MNIQKFISGGAEDERAVSPVIGVILMVAITVILAAVIGAFVLNLGGKLSGGTAPQAQLSASFPGSGGQVQISHQGGDQLKASNLNVKLNGGTFTNGAGSSSESWSNAATSGQTNGTISAGDTTTFKYSGSPSTVKVVWSSPGGGSSQVLLNKQVP